METPSRLAKSKPPWLTRCWSALCNVLTFIGIVNTATGWSPKDLTDANNANSILSAIHTATAAAGWPIPLWSLPASWTVLSLAHYFLTRNRLPSPFPDPSIIVIGSQSIIGEKGTGVITSRLNRADGTTELEAQRRSVQHGGP